MSTAVLAIDQGTTATKAMVVRDDGAILSVCEQPVRVRVGANDAVEIDASELLRSVLAAGEGALADAGHEVAAVGLANQGETVLVWDRATGAPMSPCVVWQDRRAWSVCRDLIDARGRLHELSGLHLDPYFSAPKMAWLRRNGYQGGVATTSDTWLVHQLTGQFVTDLSTASRSMLLDLHTLDWSNEAWSIFDLHEDRPRLVASDDIAGVTRHFGAELPVAGLIVDQQAALWAQRCVQAGQAKCTYGTGAFLLANTGDQPVTSNRGLAASLAWRTRSSTRWCLDAQAYTVGAAFEWLTRVGLLTDISELDAVLDSTPATAGVAFLPALAGLGAPHWRPDTRGSFTGLALSTTAAHMVRAAAEGIAFLVAELADAIEDDLDARLDVLRVDGGLTRSTRFLQLQADVLGIPVHASESPHATGVGTADLALRAVTGQHLPEPTSNDDLIQPTRPAPDTHARREAWRSAVGLHRSTT
jgi:glycerol kinase